MALYAIVSADLSGLDHSLTLDSSIALVMDALLVPFVLIDVIVAHSVARGHRLVWRAELVIYTLVLLSLIVCLIRA